MFGGLRQGSLLYILKTTNEGADLLKGTVESVSNPLPKYGNQVYGQPAEMAVDVKVRCGEEVYELNKLSTGMDMANSNGLVVSDNKAAMSAEVEAMQRSSQKVLDSKDYHERVVAKCEDFLKELNPQFAKEKEQEEKIGMLEAKMDNIEGTLGNIQSMLSSVLSASAHKKKEE